MSQVAKHEWQAHRNRGHRSYRKIPRDRWMVDHRPDDLRQRRLYDQVKEAFRTYLRRLLDESRAIHGPILIGPRNFVIILTPRYDRSFWTYLRSHRVNARR